MKVFIVMTGEKCEGGRVVSIHETKQGAREAALEVKPCFEGGWKETGYLYWENGCDWLKVIPENIKK